MKFNIIINLLLLISYSLNPIFKFEAVNNQNIYMQTISNLINKTIAPLYGDQSEAIKKIGAAEDRLSYLLLNEENDPLGVIIFKKNLSQEFELFEINNAIELKTLFVVDPDKNSNKGLGSMLLNQCLEYAKSINAKYIVVTVSEEKPESLLFFQKKGFNIIYTLENKYKSKTKEYIIAKLLS
jgi:GNAT superfamily N-acetyltransferase